MRTFFEEKENHCVVDVQAIYDHYAAKAEKRKREQKDDMMKNPLWWRK